MLQIVAIAAGVIGMLAGLAALRTLRRLRRTIAVLHKDGRGASVAEIVARCTQRMDGVEAEIAGLHRRIDEHIGVGLERVAVVRYDALPGMGGRMSWSVALLNDHGDGLIFTTISGRNDTRSYVKVLVAGESKHPLSKEEQHAIDRARDEESAPAALRKSA